MLERSTLTIKGHVFNETHLQRLCLCQRHKVQQLVLVEASHHHTVHLQGATDSSQPLTTSDLNYAGERQQLITKCIKNRKPNFDKRQNVSKKGENEIPIYSSVKIPSQACSPFQWPYRCPP